VLATWANDYLAGLQATRYRGSATSSAAHDGVNLWVARFAAACLRAVADATVFEQRTQSLQAEWRDKLGRIRRDSATDLLLHVLPRAPVITVGSAAADLGRTFRPVNDAVERLTEAGILRQISVGRRNRAFEAPDLIDAFTDLERRLASPAGDTRISAPSRRVPLRRTDPSGGGGVSRSEKKL
jgi:hypothetical protein